MKIAIKISADPATRFIMAQGDTIDVLEDRFHITTGNDETMVQFHGVASDYQVIDGTGFISPFRGGKSHTWDGTAPVSTSYVFPTPPAKQPAPITEHAVFLKAMVTGIGVAKANDIMLKYPIIVVALLTARVMEWDKGNVKALIALAKTNGDLTDQNIADIRAAWVSLNGK